MLILFIQLYLLVSNKHSSVFTMVALITMLPDFIKSGNDVKLVVRFCTCIFPLSLWFTLHCRWWRSQSGLSLRLKCAKNRVPRDWFLWWTILSPRNVCLNMREYNKMLIPVLQSLEIGRVSTDDCKWSCEIDLLQKNERFTSSFIEPEPSSSLYQNFSKASYNLGSNRWAQYLGRYTRTHNCCSVGKDQIRFFQKKSIIEFNVPDLQNESPYSLLSKQFRI